MIRPFINTLTPHEKFFLGNQENLPQPIQVKLSRKLKIFLNFLLHFSNLHLIFNILKRNNEFHRLCLSQIIDCKICAYLNIWRVTFQYTQGQSTCERVPNTVKICTTVFSSSLFITPAKFLLEKVFLSNTWNFKNVF